MRAVRKNGEVLGGCFMIGAKWAVSSFSTAIPISVISFLAFPQDPAQAEALLGQPVTRSNFAASVPQNQNDSSPAGGNNAMAVDEPYPPPHSSTGTPTVGTPIKLAPSVSAFRKTPGVTTSTSKPATPHNAGWSGALSQSANTPNPRGVQPSPSKSVMGQVSDLIFGW